MYWATPIAWNPRRLTLSAAMAGIVSLFVSCSSGPVPRPTPTEEPPWVRDLGEEIGVERTAEATQLLPAPTDDSAYGRPLDISQPLNGKNRPSAERGGIARSTAGPIKATEGASALEALFQGDIAPAPDRAILQFGYEFFAPTEAGAEERATAALRSDYVLGSGDEILLNVTGGTELTDTGMIGRDGSVELPFAGVVQAAGETVQSLERIVQSIFEKEWRDVTVSLRIGMTRTIRVHVVGHAEKPGAFDLPAHASVLDVLVAAHGPSKRGSMRKIRVQTAMDEATVDLYPLLMGGDDLEAPVLTDGAIISIPPIGDTIGVAGQVQRPAIFEVLEDCNVAKLLELAAGQTPFAYEGQLQLERIGERGARRLVELPTGDQLGTFTLQDGDLLLVGGLDATRLGIVGITGEVVRPGDYAYQPGMRLRDLVKRAGGLRIDASREQIIISRQVAAPRNVPTVNEGVPQQTSRQILLLDVLPAMEGDPQHNVELRPLDHVTIQPRRATAVIPTVQILGAVQRPGRYELTGGLRVSDLIALAGNLMPIAHIDAAELVRNIYDVEAQQLSVKRFRVDLGRLDSDDVDADPLLHDGDRLVVRQLHESAISVKITGEVRFPGTYVFPADAKITDALSAAGGVLSSGQIQASKLMRRSVQQLQSRRFRELSDILREQAESSYTRLVQVGTPREALAAKIELEHTRELIARMARYQPDGRIVIPWDHPTFPDSPFNLTIEDGDHIEVARRQETVSIIGHVFNPGAFVATPDLDLLSLIDWTGGLTEEGDRRRAYIIRTDGTVQLVEASSRSRRRRVKVRGGDVVMIPRRKLERTFMAQATDALNLLRSGAESALILQNLNQSQLGITYIPQNGSQYDNNTASQLLDR